MLGKKLFWGKGTNEQNQPETVLTDKIVFIAIAVSLTGLALSISLLAIKFGSLPAQLPLFYSRPWGEAILAKTFTIWLLPAMIVLFLLFDLIFYRQLAKFSQFLLKIIALSLLASSVLITWTLVKIILLVS